MKTTSGKKRGSLDRRQGMPTDHAFNIAAKLPADSKRSSWFGYECCDFIFEGRGAKVIKPMTANARHSWAWRAEFFGHEPQADLALLENGFHIVFMDVCGLNGSPQAMDIWDKFYLLMTKAGLEKKSTMIGMSRGGLYSYNWAIRHPDRVACIYGDNPVIDICSWPGGLGKGKGDDATWEQVLKQYGLTKSAVKKWKGGPLDNLKPLVKEKIALLHIVGDADAVVPVSENTGPLEQRVHELGGEITVIHKPRCGHHPHSLPDPRPITEFILKAYGLRPMSNDIPAVGAGAASDSALSIVGRYRAEFTAPPKRIPTDRSVDAPLLGNGDTLVALGGGPEKLQFYINKNDLWVRCLNSAIICRSM